MSDSRSMQTLANSTIKIAAKKRSPSSRPAELHPEHQKTKAIPFRPLETSLCCAKWHPRPQVGNRSTTIHLGRQLSAIGVSSVSNMRDNDYDQRAARVDSPLPETSPPPLRCIVWFVVLPCQIGRPEACARRSASAAIAAMSPPNRSDISRRMRWISSIGVSVVDF